MFNFNFFKTKNNQKGGITMQANQIPFDHTVGTGIQQNRGGMVMNKQTEVKVLVVSDQNVRFAKEARISTVITTVHRGLYEVLRVANGTRKITVAVYEKDNVQNAVQVAVAFRGYRKENNTFYAQVQLEHMQGNAKLVPGIENIRSVAIPDLEFPKQEPQHRRVKAIAEQPVKHVEGVMSQVNSEPVKQTKQEMKEEEQPMTELQACLHRILKVVKDKKTRQQIIALAAHIEHKGYQVNADQFAKYASAIGRYDFNNLLSRIDVLHGGKTQVEYVREVLFGNSATKETSKEELDPAVIERVKESLKEDLKKAGIDINNKEAVVNYVAAHKDEILAKINNKTNSDELTIDDEYEEVYADILKGLKEYEAVADTAIYAALQMLRLRSKKHEELILFITRDYFKKDVNKIGEHFRKELGRKGFISAKEVAYYTADTVRATGDIIQRGFELAGQGINYLFHAVASLIEKPVGGRPEHLKDVNLVKTAVKQKFHK